MIQSSWHTKIYLGDFCRPLQSLPNVFSCRFFLNMNFLQMKKYPVDRPVKYFASPKSIQVHKQMEIYTFSFISMCQYCHIKGSPTLRVVDAQGLKSTEFFISLVQMPLALPFNISAEGRRLQLWTTHMLPDTYIGLQVFAAFGTGTTAHLGF